MGCISLVCAQDELNEGISLTGSSSTLALDNDGNIKNNSSTLAPLDSILNAEPRPVDNAGHNNYDGVKGLTACYTKEKHERGYCVMYYLCDNNTINYDGNGLIDSRCGLPHKEFKMEENIIIHQKRQLNQTTTNADDVTDLCQSFLEVCCLPPSDFPAFDDESTAYATEKRVGCGYLNTNGVDPNNSSVSSNHAKFGEFPWMVAIIRLELLKEENLREKLKIYIGGGSLIHFNVVLTAAYNVIDLQEMIVRAGEWDTKTKNKLYEHQERRVSSVVIHKDFNKKTLYYNAALVFLSAPIDAAPHVGVACLPRANERARAGSRCFTSGWGRDTNGIDGRYQHILKKVDVPVVDRIACQQSLRQNRLGPFYMLHRASMCAGGEANKDACYGDGGSPLVCPIEHQDDRYVQNGIVSWGLWCGLEGIPGVYVDVASVRGWIDREVISKGYDVSSYTY